MIAVIDYGVGNLFSLCRSLEYIGAEAEVTNDIARIENADKIILPGVGAFADAADKLKNSGMGELVIREAKKGKPLMGICLGMQLLFRKSYEFGEYEGLGLLEGQVVGMNCRLPENLKIPHIGWNALHFTKESPLFRYIHENDCVYFVHSFYAENCSDSVIATTAYGLEITAAVQKDNIMGCQFHPEKSGKVGLNILKAFAEG